MCQNRKIPNPSILLPTLSFEWIDTFNSKSCRKYYYNNVLGEIQWHCPIQLHLPLSTPHTSFTTIYSLSSSDSSANETAGILVTQKKKIYCYNKKVVSKKPTLFSISGYNIRISKRY